MKRLLIWLGEPSIASNCLQWLIAFLLALAIGLSFIILGILIMGAFIDAFYPIVEGQKDLGLGVLIVFITFIFFLCAIPIVAFCTSRLKKKLSNILVNYN